MNERVIALKRADQEAFRISLTYRYLSLELSATHRRHRLVRIRTRTRPIAVVAQRRPHRHRSAARTARRRRHRQCGRHIRALLVHVQAQLLQLQIVADQLLLFVVQLAQFALVRGHLLAHHARRVPAEALPFARQLAALLAIVVQEAAQIAQLLVVVAQPLVGLLQAAQLRQHGLQRMRVPICQLKTINHHRGFCATGLWAIVRTAQHINARNGFAVGIPSLPRVCTCARIGTYTAMDINVHTGTR